MEIDAYARVSSPVHSWDIRFKLISLMLYALVTASCRHFPPLFFAAASAVVLTALTRLPLLFILRYIRAPFVLLLLLVPILLFTAGGEALASVWKIDIYADGVYASGQIALKLLSVLLFTLSIFGTSKMQDTFKGMEKLKIPSTLTAIFLFTYRYIFLYTEILKQQFIAARLRGLDCGRGLRKYATSMNIMVSLLLRSYEQSERVYLAMNLRGFTGSYPSLTRFHSNWKDIVKSGVVFAACTVVLYLELL